MKTLLVLRHAKAERGDTAMRDHDRPLAPRGEADAPHMGIALRALGAIPDRLLTSPAVRACETARFVAAAMGYNGPIVEETSIYAASVETLLAVLCACDDASTVLLVGHNPGLEELIGLLAGGVDAEPMVRLPTAGLAYLSLDIEGWPHLRPACGQLHWLLTPRIVSPLLHATHDHEANGESHERRRRPTR